MNFPEKRHEFSINEFAHACGVSRKTLLRMEECGFLKPYRINKETGYRYFDAYNAAQVGQFQLLQMMGLSRVQIADYYNQKLKNTEFLKLQREKLNQMLRVLEEMELREDPSRSFIPSIIDLPEITCYCETTVISSPEQSEPFFYATQEQCMRSGYQLLGVEPLFGLNEDDFRTLSIAPSQTTACIPIVPTGKDDPHIVTFPASRAFSMLSYGDYTVIGELCSRFWKAFDKKKLTPTGRARFIGITAPYVGEHISYSNFCYRLVVPVETVI